MIRNKKPIATSATPTTKDSLAAWEANLGRRVDELFTAYEARKAGAGR